MLAVSTAWNAQRHTSGRAIIDELLALGFEDFEINVHFSEEMLKEIELMAREGAIRIGSLHNYCPIPLGFTHGSGDLYLMSDLDESQRRLAVENTKRTLDWAKRLGAGAIVAHWGEVTMFNPQKSIVRRILEGDLSAKEEMRQLYEQRNQQKQPYLEQSLKSLQEISEYAKSLNIRLGLETRYYFHQFPGIEEMGMMLDVAPEVTGYWHDNGHAMTQQFIGIARHDDYLDRFGDRLMGLHLMDIIEGDQDHHALGHGDYPVEQYAPLLTKAHWQVMEIHRATPEELVASRARLQACGFGG